MSIKDFEQQQSKAASSDYCCHVRDTLIKQLKDEEDGVIFYSQMAGELGILGKATESNELNNIANDEFRHYLELRGIIDILTESCSCTRKNIGPPFG